MWLTDNLRCEATNGKGKESRKETVNQDYMREVIDLYVA